MPLPAAKFRATPAELEFAQLHFDWMVPFRTKQLLTTKEAGRCLGRGDNFVRGLVEEGKLEAHSDTASGERESLRVTRRSITVHLSRTSQLHPEDFYRQLADVAFTLNKKSRKALADALLKSLDAPEPSPFQPFKKRTP